MLIYYKYQCIIINYYTLLILIVTFGGYGGRNKRYMKVIKNPGEVQL
jgi:hypothetical protein